MSDVDDVSDDAVATADLLVVVMKALPGREEEDVVLRPTATSGVLVGRLVTPGDTVKADVVEAEEATTVAKAIAENLIFLLIYIVCRIKYYRLLLISLYLLLSNVCLKCSCSDLD